MTSRLLYTTGLICSGLALIRRELAVCPVFAAQRDVTFVAAQKYLLAVLDDLAVVYARITYRLVAAPAYCLDFLDAVRPREQPLTALKQIALKIGAQALTYHGYAHVVHNVYQPLNLRLGQKLRFVYDYAIVIAQRQRVHLLDI